MTRPSTDDGKANTKQTRASQYQLDRDGNRTSGAAARPPLMLPPRIPRRPRRPAQRNIPNDRSVRDRIRRLAQQYAEDVKLVPPLALDELREHAARVCASAGADPIYREFTAIIVNNEAWRETVAGIPYDRRLLLLPQCLRADGQCRAPIDEFGLVCQGCGSCSLHDLQTEAEQLGYAVLVAEGSAVVTEMIATGRIDAVIGVSCMSVLEKCFPHMEARAVPGLATPLLQDGCANTSVDLDWVRDAIHLTSADKTHRLNLDGLKRSVQSWFGRSSLDRILGPVTDQTEAIARDWLARAGKRWRPYLTACVCMSLRCDDSDEPLKPDENLKKLAVAVECFHKASLIHDDIEDGDETRYGCRALHIEHGTPVALNIGDFLLGEGYRLIGELDIDDSAKAAMLRAAAVGHVTLSRGQGAELCWARDPAPMSTLEVLDVFRQKTSPAFEVALRLGALHGGADDRVHDVLGLYSEALGIAYQIRDDLEDFAGLADSNDLRDLRPSVVLAIAHKRADEGAERKLTTSLWRRKCQYDDIVDRVGRLVVRHDVIETVEGLLEAYIAQATRSLRPLESHTLKGLLRRVIGKIFGDEQIQGYCRELEARYVAGRAVGTEPAA